MVTVIVLDNRVFAEIITIETARIDIPFIIDSVAGFIVLPQSIVAIVRIRGIASRLLVPKLPDCLKVRVYGF